MGVLAEIIGEVLKQILSLFWDKLDAPDTAVEATTDDKKRRKRLNNAIQKRKKKGVKLS